METTRFGKLDNYKELNFKDGILGYEKYKKWTIVDPGDSTFILWLQSLDNPKLAMPIIKPQYIDVEYTLEGAVYNILMIPPDIRNMSANTKAPIVVSGNEASQVMINDEPREVQKNVYKILKSNIINC